MGSILPSSALRCTGKSYDSSTSALFRRRRGDAEDILHVARGEGVNGLGGSELEEGGTDAFYVAGWAIVALFMFTTTEISLL